MFWIEASPKACLLPAGRVTFKVAFDLDLTSINERKYWLFTHCIFWSKYNRFANSQQMIYIYAV